MILFIVLSLLFVGASGVAISFYTECITLNKRIMYLEGRLRTFEHDD